MEQFLGQILLISFLSWLGSDNGFKNKKETNPKNTISLLREKLKNGTWSGFRNRLTTVQIYALTSVLI